MKTISLFIYDLDGTLIDSAQDIINCVHKTLKHYNLAPRTDAQVLSFIGQGVRELMELSVGQTEGPLLEEVLHYFKQLYQKHLLDETRLYPGIDKVISHFQNKIQTVVTNKSQGFTDLIMAGLKIESCFSAVIGAEGEFPRKPDPSSVLHLMKEFNAKPEHTVIVGDSDVDMQTGKNAGILTCGVTWGLRPREEIVNAKPDFMIERPEELMKLFE